MIEFERLHMPSLSGATGWLDAEPLGPAELQGHVVLVNVASHCWQARYFVDADGIIRDVPLDVTNPGIWMAHCLIAEHHERGDARLGRGAADGP